jgi:hypothetical protein
MLSLLKRTELSEAQTDILRLGLEAAMLRRHMSFGIGPFVPLQIARYEEIMTLSDSVPGDYGKTLRAMSLLAMSHHAFAEGDSKAALDFALAAVAADTRHLEALVTVGRLQLNAGRTVEAFDAALRAWTVAPDGRGLRRLLADCEFGIEHSHFLEMVQSGRAQLVAARFDSGAYLTDHPDIAKAGLDPWHHYCEYGWREGRKFRLLHLNG